MKAGEIKKLKNDIVEIILKDAMICNGKDRRQYVIVKYKFRRNLIKALKDSFEAGKNNSDSFEDYLKELI